MSWIVETLKTRLRRPEDAMSWIVETLKTRLLMVSLASSLHSAAPRTR